MSSQPVTIDGTSLTIEQFHAAAHGAEVTLCPVAKARMEESAHWLAERSDALNILGKKRAWLVGLSDDRQQSESVSAETDQKVSILSFIKGHCAGVGSPLREVEVRAMMVARLNVIAKGLSGCRPLIVQRYIQMLNQSITPVVPSKGSVGAAGGAQLAHVLQVVLGMGGRAMVNGKVVPAAEAVRHLGEIEISGKEALSLINGSSLTTALGALAVHRAQKLLTSAEAAAALTFEVVRADTDCLNLDALQARGHAGAVDVAARVLAQLKGSNLVAPGRAPDPFSIRCMPAVFGAADTALGQIKEVVTTDLNGANDNPLIFAAQGQVHEVGNFHGAPVALAMDHLKVALTMVASMSERRTFRLTYGQLSGLPSFLVEGTGLNSGLMIAQYTAASLVSECKVLSHPASVDSIPTVQHNEDHVSMGPIAARSVLKILDALSDVVAIELMCGAQGLDFRLDVEGTKAGVCTEISHAAVRDVVDRWTEDRVLETDLTLMGGAVRSGVWTGCPSAW